MKPVLPRARQTGLIIKHLPDETLVYDLEKEKAHCLNQTATFIWKNCDGAITPKALAGKMERELGQPVSEEMIWLALDQLERFNLLEDRLIKPMHLASMSRRDLVRRIGVAALLLPAIVSITAPTAQAQVSCIASGNLCHPQIPCCDPGGCNPSGRCR